MVWGRAGVCFLLMYVALVWWGPVNCQYEGGDIPECGDGGYYDPRMELGCIKRMDAYEVDWSDWKVRLDVTCESAAEDSSVDSLPDCRSEMNKGDVWDSIQWYEDLTFVDAFGVYQSSEWNVIGPSGVLDKSWASKVLPGGKGCNQEDGYCRKKRKCTVTGNIYGAVKEIGGGGKIHDWDLIMTLYNLDLRFKRWSSPRVKDYGKFTKTVRNCVVCQVVPCDKFTCPNGKILGVPVPTIGGAVVRRPVCSKECSAGTFLTCRTRERCEYQPITDAQNAAGGAGYRLWYDDNVRIDSDINIVPVGQLSPPVEDCYPCKFADRRAHGGIAQMTESGQASKGFLSFSCPGGAKIPEDCPVNQVTKVDPVTSRTSVCGCKNGMVYNEIARECQPCKAGHYCAWSGMSPPREVECPLDYYAESGWDACKKCDTRRQCDPGQALTRCLPSRASGRSGEYQTHDSECVNCAECQQLSGLRDSVPCYKVSPIVGFA